MNVIPVNNNNENLSYAKATAVGGITGYALKYALPLQEAERKEVFGDSFKLKREGSMYRARLNEYNAIEKSMKDGSENFSDETVTFFKGNKKGILKSGEGKGLEEKIKALSDTARAEVGELMERIHIKGVEKGEFLHESYTSYAKRSRPAFYYIAVGAAIALCITTLKNYFSSKKHRPEGISIII